MSARSSPRLPPEDGTPVQRSFADEASAAADLFDLAAPPLQQPLVARLVPVYAGLPTLALHQDSGTVVVGRGKDIAEEYRVDCSDKLSARHCELRVDAVTLRVELRDLSTNGTYLNGSRITKGEPVALQAGDRVALTRPAESASGAGGGVPVVGDVAANGRLEYVFQRLKAETSRARMTEELTCSICRGIFHRPCSVLPCMHVFCAGCISGWIDGGERCTCPECRQAITDVRPTHRLQSCADLLLLSDPASRRPAEELAQLDAADKIPPSGVKLDKRRRDSGDDYQDGSGDYDEDGDASGSGSDTGRQVRHAALVYGSAMPLAAAARCDECDAPSSVDGFQCPAGGPHLRCTACSRPFPERPLCGRPQRCHVCNLAFCQLYRADGCRGDDMLPFKPFNAQAPSTTLPPQTFNGNAIEQSILSAYLAAHNILVADAWAITLEKFEHGTWAPDMVLINGAMRADTPVCARCAAKVFAELLFHYRRSIPADQLPESVTRRPNCWYGKECRTQFHKPQHAQNFNHVCYQEKRKE